MKIKRRFLPAIVAATLCFPMTLQAMEGNTVSGNDATSLTVPAINNMSVTYEQEPAFTISIPKELHMSPETKSGTYGIMVKGSIGADDILVVEPVDEDGTTEGVNFLMHDLGGGKEDVIATVTQDITRVDAAALDAAGDDGITMTGTVSAEGLSAGSWSGSLKFDVHFEDK